MLINRRRQKSPRFDAERFIYPADDALALEFKWQMSGPLRAERAPPVFLGPSPPKSQTIVAVTQATGRSSFWLGLR